MASGKKISELDQAGVAQNADELAIVQSGKTNRIPLRDPTGGVDDLWAQVNPCGVECATLTIPTASVLTLNATPLTIVAAPGAGLAVEFVAGSCEVQFNSVAYATNVALDLRTNTATQEQAASRIDASVSSIKPAVAITAIGAADTQIIENQALLVEVPGGDPTAGDSTVIVRVMYRLISV